MKWQSYVGDDGQGQTLRLFAIISICTYRPAACGSSAVLKPEATRKIWKRNPVSGSRAVVCPVHLRVLFENLVHYPDPMIHTFVKGPIHVECVIGPTLTSSSCHHDLPPLVESAVRSRCRGLRHTRGSGRQVNPTLSRYEPHQLPHPQTLASSETSTRTQTNPASHSNEMEHSN